METSNRHTQEKNPGINASIVSVLLYGSEIWPQIKSLSTHFKQNLTAPRKIEGIHCSQTPDYERRLAISVTRQPCFSLHGSVHVAWSCSLVPVGQSHHTYVSGKPRACIGRLRPTTSFGLAEGRPSRLSSASAGLGLSPGAWGTAFLEKTDGAQGIFGTGRSFEIRIVPCPSHLKKPCATLSFGGRQTNTTMVDTTSITAQTY